MTNPGGNKGFLKLYQIRPNAINPEPHRQNRPMAAYRPGPPNSQPLTAASPQTPTPETASATAARETPHPLTKTTTPNEPWKYLFKFLWQTTR